MGTYFVVETYCEHNPLQKQILNELDRLNQIFSTYIPESQISRFNEGDTERWVEVDIDFVTVVTEAQKISELTDGAFDPTVGPLVEEWGFGNRQRDSIPDPLVLAELAKNIGLQHVKVRTEPSSLLKSEPVSLDLSAIAKGFAVDKLSELVESLDCGNYMVDIGGEVSVRGINLSNRLWRIGIQHPLAKDSVLGYLTLSQGALASSGTYANRFLHSGVEYSHIIDPRTGWPIDHKLVSVSVFSDNAMQADGLATAMLVMGTQGALDLAEAHGLAVLLIERTHDDQVKLNATRAFKEKLVLQP